MNLLDVGILYAAGGLVSGFVAWRRSKGGARGRVLGSAALCVVLWPLWLPVLLASTDAARQRPRAARDGTELALLEGHEAVRGTPFESLLPRDAVERILGELRRAAERHDELTQLLGRSSFGVEAARLRVAKLEGDGASPRALASARLHLENLERLDALRRRDELALQELAELASALRTQLVFARYAGSTPVGATDIVSEVCARVEVLGSSMDELAPLRET